MKYLLSLFIYTTALHSSCLEKSALEEYSKLLMQEKFTECLDLVDSWQDLELYDRGTILGLKSSVYFSLGDMQAGLSFLQASRELLDEERSQKLKALVKEFIYDVPYDLVNMQSSNFLSHILLSDKLDQPKGVKIRYWVGVGQIIAGIIATPFSGGAGGTLIVSGIAATLSAAGEAMDNQDEWQKKLDHNERIDGKAPQRDNSSSKDRREQWKDRKNTYPTEEMGHFWDTNRPIKAIIDHDQLMNKELKGLIFI